MQFVAGFRCESLATFVLELLFSSGVLIAVRGLRELNIFCSQGVLVGIST